MIRTVGRAALSALVLVASPWAAEAGSPGGSFILLDASGAPVARARITVVSSSATAVTDADGGFVLSPIPSPPVILSVFSREGVWLGYARIGELSGPGPHVLRLPPLERVEVSAPGGSTPETLAPPAAATTVITRAERSRTRPARLVEVMNEVPGAQQLGAGQTAVPSLRGLSRGRTLLLLDDARIATERRAGASATYLDPFSLESVEVVRGPGSVAYGSDALGGIIHSRTPSPDPDRPIVRFVLSGETAAGSASGGVEANLPAGKGAFLVQSHQRSFDDYRSPLGDLPGSAARDRGALVKWLAPAGEARWTFGLQFDEAIDVGRPTPTADGTEVSYPEEESLRLTAHAELPAPGWLSDQHLQIFAGSYSLVTQRDSPRTGTSNRRIERSDVESSDAALRWGATRARGDNVLRFGLDAASRIGLSADNILVDFDSAGNRSAVTRTRAVESADRHDAGIYAEDEHLLAGGRVSLLGGLRGQGIWTRNRGGLAGDRTTRGSTATGYAAATWRFAEPWYATAQIARGFREPTLSDRYFTGATGRGFITGNPELQPETTRQIDLSVGRPGTRWSLAAYLYDYRIFDLVERFESSPGLFAFRNRGEARISGVEIESSLELPAHFGFRASFNHARGETASDSLPTDDVPGPALRVALQQTPVPRFWWRIGCRYQFEDDRPGPNELPTPGYAVVDLAAGLRLTEGLEIRFTGSNLLDKVHPASPDEDGVVAPGFSAGMALEGRF